MISKVTPAFWRTLKLLEPSDRDAARRAFWLFSQNPSHNSLRFKKLAGYASLWSVRVTLNVRVVGHRSGETITWVWIGRHDECDKLFG